MEPRGGKRRVVWRFAGSLTLAAALVGCAGIAERSVSGSEGFDVQGHRGARGLLPENTISGFALAMDLGVSTLELDLGWTRDEAVVVSHDPQLDPKLCLRADGTALPSSPPLRLRDLTLVEVQGVDCGSRNPDPGRFPEPPRRNLPGERIPTLDAVFELVKTRSDANVHFNLETKVVPGDSDEEVESFVARVVDIVRRHGMVGRTTLQSFDWRALVVADRLEPGLSIAVLVAPDTLDPTWTTGLPSIPGETVLDLVARLDAEVDILSPFWRMWVPGSMSLGLSSEDAHAAGLRVIPWTVNDPATMERLIDLGVDGLISDRPDRLLEVVRGRGLRVAP